MIFDIKKSIKGVKDHDNYKDNGFMMLKEVVESSNIGITNRSKLGKKIKKIF